MKMKLFNAGKIGRKLLVSSTISGVIFIIYVFYSFWEIDHLFATNARLQVEVDEIQTALHSLYQALLNEESGQRGYNLTGGPHFLESFVNGSNEFTNSAEYLFVKIENQPAIKEDVSMVIEKGQLWHEQYGTKLIEMTQNGQQPSIALYEQSKVSFDEFRDSFQGAIVAAGNLRDTYRNLYRGKISTAMITLFIISLILVILNAFIINRQTRSIVEPIIKLNTSVKAYTNKDFGIGIPKYSKDDELAELIQNVNTMRLELHEKFKMIESLADIDGNTGVYNRRYFDERIKKEWAKASYYGKPISLILLDIDYFKNFNDTYGHLEGDRCLKKISTKLQEIFKNSSDVVARFGGEEFAVILPEQTEEFVYKKAEKLRQSIMDLKIPHESSEDYKIVTISIGVTSIIPMKESNTPTQLISLADQALYESKANGRNRVTQYTDSYIQRSGSKKQFYRTS